MHFLQSLVMSLRAMRSIHVDLPYCDLNRFPKGRKLILLPSVQVLNLFLTFFYGLLSSTLKSTAVTIYMSRHAFETEQSGIILLSLKELFVFTDYKMQGIS